MFSLLKHNAIIKGQNYAHRLLTQHKDNPIPTGWLKKTRILFVYNTPNWQNHSKSRLVVAITTKGQFKNTSKGQNNSHWLTTQENESHCKVKIRINWQLGCEIVIEALSYWLTTKSKYTLYVLYSITIIITLSYVQIILMSKGVLLI